MGILSPFLNSTDSETFYPTGSEKPRHPLECAIGQRSKCAAKASFVIERVDGGVVFNPFFFCHFSARFPLSRIGRGVRGGIVLPSLPSSAFRSSNVRSFMISIHGRIRIMN